MMRALRDKRLMHVVLWGLVLVFVSFIFLSWGMKFSGTERRDPNVLADVGSETVTYAEFNKIYQPAVEKLYKMKEENPTSDEIKKLKDEVLDSLVDDAILRQTAVEMGLSVPDDELVAALQRQSYFQDDNGKFDKKKYYQVLAANQLTPEEFENAQKDQILLQKIKTVLDDGILISNDDLKNYTLFLNRELKASYVALDVDAYEKKVPSTEADLKSYYQNTKSQYDHPERIKIRHILISLQGSENLQDQEKAKASLEDYRKQILSKKATFQELAEKYSQDGGSKAKGGELGWLSRNSMGDDLRDFETAIFKLKKGEISQPIKSKFGYHLVMVEDHEKEYKSTFAEVRAKVEQQYRKEKAAEMIFSISEKLSAKLKNKESLAKAASEMGLTSEETPWFSRSTGIPHLKDSLDISDSLADLYPNEWKGPLELGQKEIFFQVTDSRESGKNFETLEKDTPNVAQRLISSQQEAWMNDFLTNQKKKLKVKTYLNG